MIVNRKSIINPRSLKKPVQLLLLAFMVAAYLFATLYPFNFLSNGAVMTDGVAVFARYGILRTREPPAWMSDAIRGNRLTVRLVLRPYYSVQTGPARIFTISQDHYHRNVTVGHDGQDLVVRLRRSTDTMDGLPPFIVPDVFTQTNTRNVVVSIQQNILQVWVDNLLLLHIAMPDDILEHWNSNFLLALGNELTSERPWLGEVAFAQIETAAGTVDLLSPSLLIAPRITAAMYNSFQLFSRSLTDLLANLLIFIPIGMMTAGCMSTKKSSRVLLLWLPVCLIAEVLQFFVEGRFSSVSDLFLNVMGAQIGAYGYLIISRRCIE